MKDQPLNLNSNPKGFTFKPEIRKSYKKKVDRFVFFIDFILSYFSF